jgi:hypothetical protein
MRGNQTLCRLPPNSRYNSRALFSLVGPFRPAFSPFCLPSVSIRTAHTVVVPVVWWGDKEPEPEQPTLQLYVNKYAEILAARRSWKDLLKVFREHGKDFDVGDYAFTFNLLGMTMKERAGIAPGSATLLRNDPDFARLVENATGKVDTLNAELLAAFAKGIGCFGSDFYRRAPRLQSLLAAVAKTSVSTLQFRASIDTLEALLANLGQLSPAEALTPLTQLGATYAISDPDPEVIKAQLALVLSEQKQRERHFPNFSERNLCDLLWGLARVGYAQDKVLLSECAQRAVVLLPTFIPTALGTLAYAFHKLNIPYHPQLWEGLLAR